MKQESTPNKKRLQFCNTVKAIEIESIKDTHSAEERQQMWVTKTELKNARQEVAKEQRRLHHVLGRCNVTTKEEDLYRLHGISTSAQSIQEANERKREAVHYVLLSQMYFKTIHSKNKIQPGLVKSMQEKTAVVGRKYKDIVRQSVSVARQRAILMESQAVEDDFQYTQPALFPHAALMKPNMRLAFRRGATLFRAVPSRMVSFTNAAA
ncbi:MAG: hypothetical protein SGILL_002651 [Bacillariaceae sp.]